MNPTLPPELNRILARRSRRTARLRYQTATDFKTDLLRLKRDTDSGGRRAAELGRLAPGASRSAEKSVAVLYFENLSGVKEDEYFRDGVTEDIITELSKIKGLKVLSRPTVLLYRDKSVTAAQVGQQLKAAFVLTGSIRRAGNRLRITSQLVDAQTDSLACRSATTARWRTSSRCRTRSRARSPPPCACSSRRRSRRPSRRSPRTTSRPTTSTFVARGMPAA